MIQRIQSVFLLIMAMVMVFMLFFPIWGKGNPDTGELVILNAFNLTHTQGLIKEIVAQKSAIYIAILALLSAGVSIFSISRFKNRLTQMKLGALNSLLIGGIVLTCYLFSSTGSEMLISGTPPEFKIGFFLPLVALIFNSLSMLTKPLNK